MAIKQNSKSRPAPEALDGDTELRILDAAHTVFLRRGTAGARMQEIAEEAGVNQALLHYYFRSKGRLAEAVFRRAATNLLPPVIAILASDAPLEQKVEHVVHHELDQLLRTPYLPGYIISELTHFPDRVEQLLAGITGLRPEAVAPPVLGVLRRQIDEAVKAGRIRRIAPEQFMVNLLSLCIFPFAARPMIATLFSMDDDGFARFIQQRRRELPTFFLEALRP